MRDSDIWKSTTPGSLRPAVKHLREAFDENLWSATRSEDDCHKEITLPNRTSPEPEIFQRHWNSLAKSIHQLVEGTFTLLLAIASKNNLDKPIEWATSQVRLMLEDELLVEDLPAAATRLRGWIVLACDGSDRPIPPSADKAAVEAWLFYRDWQSPAWLCMKPLGNTVYDSGRAWVRDSVDISQGTLAYHSECMWLVIWERLQKLAGLAHAQLALTGAVSKTEPREPAARKEGEEADIERARIPGEYLSGLMRQSDRQNHLIDDFWRGLQEEHRRKMELADRDIERSHELEHARKLAEIKRPETPNADSAATSLAEGRASADNEGVRSNPSGSGQAPAVDSTVPARPNKFVRRDETWSVEFRGESVSLNTMVGLDYISVLLRHPGRRFKPRELRAQCAPTIHMDPKQVREWEFDLGSNEEPKRSGPDPNDKLDGRAISEYSKELKDLETKICYAEETRNLQEADRLKEEKRFIEAQLRASTKIPLVRIAGKPQLGLRRFPRRFADDNENARSAVAMAIGRALNKIQGKAPLTAEHLQSTIRWDAGEVSYADSSTSWTF